MAKTKNFSFSDFMSFSESLVDSLDAVATKIDEVTNQIETLETVLEGGDAPANADANAEEASAEENVSDAPAEESPVEEEVATEEVVTDTPADANAEEPVAEDVPADDATSESAPIDTPEETPVSEEDNDSAAIDAMSTGDENFSDKFMVVGLKNRPWGNRVIAAKDFSEKEHNKLIPTLFSTQAQAQRALTSYNVNGPANFSIRYNHINQMFGMNNTEKKSESKIINASEKPQTRYDQVKSIFNM